jgi:hypothetical protein
MADNDSTDSVKTLAGLRETLFETMDRLRRGEIDAKTANSVARKAKETCKALRKRSLRLDAT